MSPERTYSRCHVGEFDAVRVESTGIPLISNLNYEIISNSISRKVLTALTYDELCRSCRADRSP